MLEDLGTAHLIVDAFPAGIRGELDADAVPDGVVVDHVARLVRWDVYAPFLPRRPVRFATVWRTEPLHPARPVPGRPDRCGARPDVGRPAAQPRRRSRAAG
ncbi:MAG: hypothetical protein R2699_06365 [Acidimicrobiales bacterium]